MSEFLGPIHHWLYGKIGHQEELTKALAAHVKTEGWIEDTGRFERPLPPLENVIDVGNIHGWLQAQISDAETRYAALILKVLSGDDNRLDVLCDVARDFGAQYAVNPESNAEQAWRAFEDFFVNGMPCDRINRVTTKDTDSLSWEMTRDIHAQYWTECPMGSEPYYILRKSVMDGMLIGTGLRLVMEDAAHYTIENQK